MNDNKPITVCYFGTYRANYTRNQLLLKGMRTQSDLIIHECHETLWHSIEDRVEQASGGWRKPSFWLRVLKTYVRLIYKHTQMPEYDVMFIGYPGQFDAYIGRLLSWWRRKPMILDILMSLHLVAEERGLTEKSPFTGKLIFWLEKIGLRLPDLLISENDEYQQYIREKYALPKERFRNIPHGADDTVFVPRPYIEKENGRFDVVYHGTFLPSHGIEIIIDTAEKLQSDSDIQFHFYGDGPERSKIEAMAQTLNNITFHGFVSFDALLDGIAQADLMLGVFGDTKQAHFTIQNKIWEALAMKRPLISGKALTISKQLTHLQHLFLSDRDSQALADGIQIIKNDLDIQYELSQHGYQQYVDNHATESIGQKSADIIANLLVTNKQ